MFSHLFLAATAQVVKIGGLRLNLWWWPFIFTFFKTMFILLDILIVFAILLLLTRRRGSAGKVYDLVDEAVASGKISPAKIQRKWEQIKEMSEAEDLGERKQAIGKAEKILDDVLKAAAIPGENLSKRLAGIPENQMNFQDDLLWASQLRESLETDPNFAPEEEEIKRAFYVFERTLRDLNIL